MGEHFSSSSRDLVGSFLRTYSFSLSLPSLATPRLSSSEERLLPKLMPMLMPDMDMELFPQQQFLLQCVTLSPKRFARIGPSRPQEKFATPNMMKLLTPQSLNIVKRLSPPSASRPSSAIVGQDSKVVATGVVASPEVTVAHG